MPKLHDLTKKFHLVLMLLCISTSSIVFAQTAEVKKFQLLERLQKMPSKVHAGDYKDALPELNEILPPLIPMIQEDPRLKTLVAQGFYMQGVCNLELELYDAAVESFNRFTRLAPAHPNNIQARLMIGEAYLNQEDWSKIPPVVDPLVRSQSTPGPERETAFQLVSLAHTNMENWEKAMPYLQWLFQNARNSDYRKDAASRLAVSLIRLSRYEDLYRLVPRLKASQSQYDIGMNLLILDEGDRFISDTRPDLALLMYRMVVPYKDLTERLETRQVGITERVSDLELTTIKNDSLRQLIRQLEREKTELEQAALDLEAYPDYDLELRIRLGDVYHELERWEESIQIYLSVYDVAPETEIAERAMFSAFLTAFKAEEPERAWRIAQIYMREYPGGEYWEDVTLHAGGLLIQLERWEDAVGVVDKALEITPKHVTADNMLYIKGYALFQQSLIRESMQTLSILLRRYPKSAFTQNGEYWVALGHLFLEEYVEARDGFNGIVEKGNGGPVQEDANYRKGVAQYGSEDYAGATETFTTFLDVYPSSHLSSEALAMIGDMLASASKLDKAIASYQRAVEQAVSMVQADYATFQQARTYELEKRWQEILDLFDGYLNQFPDQANFTEATYWQGNALRQLGQREKALQIFYDAIVNYGNNREAFGVDFILRDLSEELQSVNGNSPLMLTMRERLQEEMSRASADQERTLVLRLQSLQFAISRNQEVKNALQTALLREDNLPYASPGVLAQMGRLSVASDRQELTNTIYEYFLENFEESDLILEALKGLGEIRISQGKFKEAEALLTDVINRFPQLPHSADAYLRLGDIFRMQERWDEAIETYNLILSVKEWRGELWPTALNRLGDTYREMDEQVKASGFYERVYILYLSYPPQAAEAYTKRASTLISLGEKSKAKEVLLEMLENPELASLAIAQEARVTLLQLP